MRIANFAAAAAALSMIVAPVAASAQSPASKLSVSSSVREGTETKDSSKAAGTLVGVVAAVLIIAGVGFGTGLFGDGDSDPNSP